MFKKNLPILTKKSWLNKLAFSLGFVGISTLIGLPILAQAYYPTPLYLFQPYAGSNYPYRKENVDLVEFLNKNKKDNFENLVFELQEAGLTESLKSGKFTVFAPTDAAFDALPEDVFDKFNQPENRLKILQYHLVSGEISEQDIAKGEIQTLEGSTVKITTNNNVVSLNGTTVESSPIETTNGVIIKVDQVLLPPGF